MLKGVVHPKMQIVIIYFPNIFSRDMMAEVSYNVIQQHQWRSGFKEDERCQKSRPFCALYGSYGEFSSVFVPQNE